MNLEAVAAEVLDALDSGRQIEPFSRRSAGMTMEDAYRVTEALRRLRAARGEQPVGRKIGFTNRNIWAEYGVHQPIWGDVYESTLQEIGPGSPISVMHLPEPRIEPEIVLGLGCDLQPGMSLDEIAAGIAWVAHGFEIVQSIYPGWKFDAADCIVDGGLHGGLFNGPRLELDAAAKRTLARDLSGLTMSLGRNGETVDTGIGANVLDGPVHALRHLVEVLGRDSLNPPLRKGEIVTTGTLTRAFPVEAGQWWSTSIKGFDLPGLRLQIA